jgi:glycosyltransferase involved in cell wall biosynthesis
MHRSERRDRRASAASIAGKPMAKPSSGSGRPPRHCMVVENHWPDIRVEREARALLARGYEVDVICEEGAGHGPGIAFEDGVTVHRLPVRRRGGAGAITQLAEYLSFFARATIRLASLHRRRRYDTVQTHNVPDFLVFAALAPKLTGAAVILDLHDLMPEFFASRFRTSMSSLIVRALLIQERLSIAVADHVITVSDPWRRTLIDRGAPADRVSVVMNLPDPGQFGVPPERPPERDRPIRILYHGTFAPRLGIDLLLDAVAALRSTHSLRLTLHGEGEMLDHLRRQARELGIDDIVTFSTTRLPTRELGGLIASADIGVVPYRNDVFTDGIVPTKLMEYAYFGVPAVVSRSSAVLHYFGADTVQLCEPGDPDSLRAAIETLVTDEDRRAMMGRRIRRFTTAHGWEREAARYSALVESLRPRRRIDSPQEQP